MWVRSRWQWALTRPGISTEVGREATRAAAQAHVAVGDDRLRGVVAILLQLLELLLTRLRLRGLGGLRAEPANEVLEVLALGVDLLLLREQPQVPQIACFDTGFHHTLPQIEQVLPLPYDAWKRGLRRYGFHGLSYEYMATALAERHGEAARGRIIVAHLGSGASLCAMKSLQSVATTMGFSALDGLMMGTRTGAIDPGALLYLLEVERQSPEQLGQMLYHQSGLLGISGISSEPRVIVQHESDAGETGERARMALELYVRRIVREIGALLAVLGGLDMLVFTAGVGEHNAFIRERVCRELAFLGLDLDMAANGVHATVVSSANSRVIVGVEPTNEEWVAARHTRQILQLDTFQPDPRNNAMYSRFLVPLDRSATAHHALDHAAILARPSETGDK